MGLLYVHIDYQRRGIAQLDETTKEAWQLKQDRLL